MEESITVGELREYLGNFPLDKKVLATWEGVYVPLKKSCIAMNWPEPYDKSLVLDALILDVDIE